MSDVKYPHVKVQLTGGDGNAFAVMAKVRNAMRRAKISEDEVKACMTEMTSGDYNHLLATAMKWVDVS